jgi:hypothetical protein
MELSASSSSLTKEGSSNEVKRRTSLNIFSKGTKLSKGSNNGSKSSPREEETPVHHHMRSVSDTPLPPNSSISSSTHNLPSMLSGANQQSSPRFKLVEGSRDVHPVQPSSSPRLGDSLQQATAMTEMATAFVNSLMDGTNRPSVPGAGLIDILKSLVSTMHTLLASMRTNQEDLRLIRHIVVQQSNDYHKMVTMSDERLEHAHRETVNMRAKFERKCHHYKEQIKTLEIALQNQKNITNGIIDACYSEEGKSVTMYTLDDRQVSLKAQQPTAKRHTSKKIF